MKAIRYKDRCYDRRSSNQQVAIINRMYCLVMIHRIINQLNLYEIKTKLIRNFSSNTKKKLGEHKLSAFSQEQCTLSMRSAAPVSTKFNSIMFVELIIFELSSFSSPSCVLFLFRCAETTMRSHSEKNSNKLIKRKQKMINWIIIYHTCLMSY